MTSNKDNGDSDACSRKFVLELQTVHAGKPNIEDKTARSIGPASVKELRRCAKRFGTQTYGFQQSLDRRPHASIVVDDEHHRRVGGHHASASVLTGNVKEKHAPRGELLVAHKRPPCDSMIERLMESP